MISSMDAKVIEANAEALGIPVSELMENAGKTVADYLKSHFPFAHVLFVCGAGNNGGDGFVAASFMDQRNTTVALLKDPSSIKTELAKRKFAALKCRVVKYDKSLFEYADVIVDCALGVGGKGKIRDPYKTFILEANESKVPIVSIDVPSGLNSDIAIIPKATITFYDVKEGMNDDNSGEIIVNDLGIPIDVMKYIGPGDILKYPIPGSGTHKGNNGRLMIIGGGPYFGAPALASKAAFRIGADIVRLFTPSNYSEVISTFAPELMITPLPGDHLTVESVDMLLQESMLYDAVLIGNGIGKSNDTMEAVIEFVRKCKTPMVIDADAISAISEMTFSTPTIITPHSGEYRKLNSECGRPEDLAGEMNVTILLKGQIDKITNGRTYRLNKTGNAAMTSAGTGDVLAGIVAGLLSKGMAPVDAAGIGAFISGKAGEYAFEEKSYGLIASDVIENIPYVLRNYLK